MTRQRTAPDSQEQAPAPGNVAVNQADDGYKVGPGHPPKEHQFKPGESGNPNGQPKHRTHLWTHFCRFLAMTPQQIRRVNRAKLTLAERAALRLALAVQKGKRCNSDHLARYSIDRDEGRAVEHLVIGEGDDLTNDECDELRKLIQGRHVPDGGNAD
jgi:hypothetical protein